MRHFVALSGVLTLKGTMFVAISRLYEVLARHFTKTSTVDQFSILFHILHREAKFKLHVDQHKWSYIPTIIINTNK